MSNITNNLKNSNYNYQKGMLAANTSNANGASAEDKSSGTRGASGTADTSVAGGAGDAGNLGIDELLGLYKSGNLTKSEMDKWLEVLKNQITELSFVEKDDIITYKFKYNNKEYTVSCSTKAAASQLDNDVITSFFSYSTLTKTYKFTDEQINTYFAVVYSYGNTKSYILKPNDNFKNIQELQKFLSSPASVLKTSQVDSNVSENQIKIILNNLKNKTISINDGISQLQSFGIVPTIRKTVLGTTISFEYNGKPYKVTISSDYVPDPRVTGKNRDFIMRELDIVAEKNVSLLIDNHLTNVYTVVDNVLNESLQDKFNKLKTKNYDTWNDLYNAVKDAVGGSIKMTNVSFSVIQQPDASYVVTVNYNKNVISASVKLNLASSLENEGYLVNYGLYEPANPVFADMLQQVSNSYDKGKVYTAMVMALNGDVDKLLELKEYGFSISSNLSGSVYTVHVEIGSYGYTCAYNATPEITQKFISAEITSIANDLDALYDLGTLYDINNVNREVSIEEAISEIDNMVKLYRLYFTNQFNMSNQFIDTIKDFAISELNLKEGSNVNLKDILTKIKSTFVALTDKSDYFLYEYTQANNKYMTQQMLFLDDENFLPTSAKTSPGKEQYKFIQYMFRKIFYKYYEEIYDKNGKRIGLNYALNYSGENYTAIRKYIIESISTKIGVPAESMTFNDIMTLLDANNNQSWLDELYDVSQNSVFAYDLETFMGDSETIDAEYIVKNLSNLKNGLYGEQLYEQIMAIFTKLNINIYININNQKNVVNYVIQMINENAGIENTDPPTISKSSLNQLFNSIFKTMDSIINNDEMEIPQTISINREVEDSCKQGLIGDCWLLAALASLNSTEAGKNIIKESITIDGEDIVIFFKGIGLSYRITKEQMVQAKSSGKYSEGDDDVLAIELATEQLRRDMDSGKVKLRFGMMYNNEDVFLISSAPSAIDGGYGEFLLYYLTGNLPESGIYKSGNGYKKAFIGENTDITEYLQSIYKKVQNGEVSAVFVYNNHEYAIVGMTDTEITYVNPWNFGNRVTISWEAFINASPEQISVTSTVLHEHEYKSENDYNNTIDYNATLDINNKEYTLNEVLNSGSPVWLNCSETFFSGWNSFNIHYLWKFGISILADFNDNKLNSVLNYLTNFYYKIYNNLQSQPALAAENGMQQTSNGIVLDMRCVLQKMIEYINSL